jgi:hypothetical protein
VEDRQRSFNGYLLGKPGPWGIVSEEGLEDLEVRDGDKLIPRDDGSTPGLHLADSRHIILRLVTTGDRETITANVAELEAATGRMRDGEAQYVFKNPHTDERFVRARPIRRSRPRTQESEHGPVFVDLALKVADPRIYSSELHQELVHEFGVSGGGFDFPIVEFPINMSDSTQQTTVAVNEGPEDAYPRIVVQVNAGTMTSVTVSNLTNGDTVTVTTSVVAGQQLIMDFDSLIRATGGPVISIDGSSRYGAWVLPRDPFRLSSGSNILILETTGGTSVATISWRDTY